MQEFKRTIFNTQFCQAASIRERVQKAIKNIVTNQKLYIMDDAAKKHLNSIKSFATTPMYELFSMISLNTSLKPFTLFNLSEVEQSQVDDILLIDGISIDGKYLGSSTPDNLKNAWVNLTPILGKKNLLNGEYPVTDIPRFHSLIVRSYLTMSYNDMDDSWLTPSLCAFVIESYSTIVARLLARAYNLNIDEFLFIQTLFATYYAQLLSPNLGNSGTVCVHPLLMRCGFLGNVTDVHDRVSSIWNSLPHDRMWVVDDIVKVIQKSGPSRMKKLETSYLYRLFSAGTMESQAMLIAMDYPPYWVHQLYKLVSNMKNPMLTNIIKTTNIKKRLDNFIKDLNHSSTLEIDR